MALPELTRRRAERALGSLCARRVPREVRGECKLTLRFRGNSVTLLEKRAHWREAGRWSEHPIAQVRFDTSTLSWQLFWRDRNGKWHPYPRIAPTHDLDSIVDEIDRDPISIFWG